MLEGEDLQRLYPRLLGDDWPRLAPGLRAFHATEVSIRGRGAFNITRGPGLLGRCMAVLARLPRSGADVPTELEVFAGPDSETWIRNFSGKLYPSQQREERGCLFETMGPISFAVRMVCEGGDLCYQLMGLWLNFGVWRIPMPHFLHPNIDARESIGLEERSLNIDIRIEMPWIGPVLRYQGCLHWEGLR